MRSTPLQPHSVLDLVHQTPLVFLPILSRELGRNLFVKLEANNPGGSMKDRVALHCIEMAEQRGSLKPGSTIVESTSGNLGVGLAIAAHCKGYRVICVTDPKTTAVNTQLMRAYGAQVVCVDKSDANGNYLSTRLETVDRLLRETPQSWWLNQYESPDNPDTHFLYTGPEILHAMEGDVDWIVAPVGTGGLVGGLSRFFKMHLPKCRIMAVDAAGSVVLGGPAGPRRQVGIGSNRVSSHLDLQLLDESVYVTDADAFRATRLLASRESLLLGCSTGSSLAGLIQRLGKTKPGSRIVVIAPDSGVKYMDTVYNDQWTGPLETESPESNLRVMPLQFSRSEPILPAVSR